MSTFDIELEKNADGEYVMPTGGIANFYFTDVDEHDDDDVDDMIYGPRGGLHDLKPVAEKLAGFGRYGDDNIAHVETGEFVVPVEIQKENPELIRKLRDAISEYGVSPDRYVVGSEYVSINPVTGQPEFFLKKLFRGIKKTVKKVVSGVKKVVKKVVKAIKPIAKPLITVGLTMLGVPPVLSGAIGGGVGGLVQGEDLKTAFKSALTGAAVAGVASGVTGAVKAISNPNISMSQGFTSGVRDAFTGTGWGGEVVNNFANKVPGLKAIPTTGERLLMNTNAGMTLNQARTASSYMNDAANTINKTYEPGAERNAAMQTAEADALKAAGYDSPAALTGTELRTALLNDPAAQLKFKELTELNATFDPSMQMTQEEIMQAALKQTGTTAGSGFFNLKNADGSINLSKAATAASIALPLAGAAVGAFNPPPQEDISDEMFDDPTDEEVAEVSPGVPEEEVYVGGTPSSPGVGQPGGGGDNGGYTPLVGSGGAGQPGITADVC